MQVGDQQLQVSTEQVAQQAPECRRYGFKCKWAALPRAHTSADIWSLGMVFWALMALLDVQGGTADVVRPTAVHVKLWFDASCSWRP
jgi:hypothetical protein